MVCTGQILLHEMDVANSKARKQAVEKKLAMHMREAQLLRSRCIWNNTTIFQAWHELELERSAEYASMWKQIQSHGLIRHVVHNNHAEVREEEMKMSPWKCLQSVRQHCTRLLHGPVYTLEKYWRNRDDSLRRDLARCTLPPPEPKENVARSPEASDLYRDWLEWQRAGANPESECAWTQHVERQQQPVLEALRKLDQGTTVFTAEAYNLTISFRQFHERILDGNYTVRESGWLHDHCIMAILMLWCTRMGYVVPIISHETCKCHEN